MKNKAAVYFALLFILIVFVLPCAAESDESEWSSKFQFSGFFKSYLELVDPVRIDGDPNADIHHMEGQIQNKLRLRLSADLNNKINFELAYEMSPTIREELDESFPGFSPNSDQNAPPYRIDDFSRNITPRSDDREERFMLTQNLDRAMLSYDPGFMSLSLGRQPISFGAAHVINPTDIIVPYSFNELDRENRPGVDAVRTKIPFGAMGEFDLGVVFGDEFKADESAAFIRSSFPLKKNQVTLISTAFRENLMVGGDISRPLGGASVWLEAAYTWADVFDEPIEEEDFFRASAGIDYNISYRDGIYVYAEYHYNGASSGEVDQYLIQTFETAYREAGVYLLGRHYLAPGISYQLTPLVTSSCGSMVNLEDGSFYVSPKVEYNAKENLYIDLGANIASGKNSKMGPWGIVEPKSEFGLYPSLYYISVRYYF